MPVAGPVPFTLVAGAGLMVAVAGATPPVEGGATMTATSSMADQLLDDYWNEFLFTVTKPRMARWVGGRWIAID